METMNKGIVLAGAILLFTVTACDKNERAYKRFIEEGRWQVTELTSGTTAHTKLPKWQIYPCADHTNYCEAKWEHQGGTSTSFFWKFTNLGGNFEFFVDTLESDTGSMAYSQCYNFSGFYKVIKTKRKELHFESYQTTGYPDKLVVIHLTRD